MTRPRAVIVGAGLGGCVLAHALLASHDVTLVERGEAVEDPRFPLRDVGLPAVTQPHFGSGLGGSTQLWHNGLIEIDEDVFERHWPWPKSLLDPYYEQAFPLLSDLPLAKIHQAIADLRRRYEALGLPALRLPGLYYPRWPRNLWESLRLDGRVTVVRGDVTGFELSEGGKVAAVTLAGAPWRVAGDVVVLAAGGLGTPVLLQKLDRAHPLPALAHAGRHYEDHPMGFVGEVQVKVPLYRLWNYQVPGTDGNLRLPLVVERDGMHISFQLRPAANYYRASRRERVGSVLNLLRRNPWNPLNYAKLFSHWDDVLDILSFKFGIRLPTRHYTLVMCAQTPAQPELAVWSETDAASGREVRLRNWVISEAFRAELRASIDDVFAALAPVITSSRVFPNWFEQLCTGAHHSGTARLSASADSGVCDGDGRVHGMANLYVCDGSLIPASGIANTGLTIAALALRLADKLRPVSPP
ncbi:MAG TPA: GMC oxidoreductase [Roseateles sp.]